MRRLLNNTQDSDTVATVRQFRRVAVFTTARDVVIVPLDCLAFMQNPRLRVLLNRYNGYVYIDNTVADAVLRENLYRVFINLIRRIIRISVSLTVNLLRFSATYRVVFACFRLCVNSQVQAIDTVSFFHRLITLLILLGRSDLMLVQVTSP